MNLSQIQKALQTAGLDGWLFYDFHNRDAIAARVLKMDSGRFASRRWFYFIPAKGEPQKLVHKIEPWRCDHLPGQKHIYLAWGEQHRMLQQILSSSRRVAMQYSPNNAIPYVSIVDGGTIDLVRSFGVEVVSSADLVGQFEARLSREDWNSHQRAGKVMQSVKDETFKEIGRRITLGDHPAEVEIQAFMHRIMRENNMYWQDGPIVAVNEHAADPHFEPIANNSFSLKKGDLVLLDLWAKENKPGSIYYDITWMGYIGESVPQQIEDIFQIVKNARDAGLQLVIDRFNNGDTLYGWEVDETTRKVIVEAGYGDYFTHRTGHSIGEEVHGNGVNIDNLETRDERKILPGTCFSIEPGIYLPEKKIGFRSELDVFVTDQGKVSITGAKQNSVIAILSS